jgi:hypothetical protein
MFCRSNWKLVPNYLYGTGKFNNKGYFLPDMYKKKISAHRGNEFVDIEVTPYHIGRPIIDFVQTTKIALCPPKLWKKPSKKGKGTRKNRLKPPRPPTGSQ